MKISHHYPNILEIFQKTVPSGRFLVNLYVFSKPLCLPEIHFIYLLYSEWTDFKIEKNNNNKK